MNNIQNSIDNLVDDIAADTLSRKKLKKTKTKEFIILSKPKITKTKILKQDIETAKQKTLGPKLIKFRKKLYRHFKGQDLILLNNNFKSLKIKIKYLAPETLLSKFVSGRYKLEKNKIIIINNKKKNSINHEFFHMASAFYDKEAKIAFCGFLQIIYFTKQALGVGLNEGYTVLLTKRYFPTEIMNNAYSYKVCEFFAKQLEKIVGKNRMETYYLSADLFGLYKYLLNFDDGSNIITLIAMLDNLVKNVSKKNTNKFEKHYELVECYLLKLFINKKQQELNNNIIDEETFNKEIKDYIESFDNPNLNLKNYVKEKEYCLK